MTTRVKIFPATFEIERRGSDYILRTVHTAQRSRKGRAEFLEQKLFQLRTDNMERVVEYISNYTKKSVEEVRTMIHGAERDG